MNRLINIIIKVLLTFVVIFVAGFINTALNGTVNSSKLMPFYLGLITFGGIFLVWRATYIKAPNSKNHSDEL
jgi:hypothetical protein